MTIVRLRPTERTRSKVRLRMRSSSQVETEPRAVSGVILVLSAVGFVAQGAVAYWALSQMGH